jgi:hypothetical protein
MYMDLLCFISFIHFFSQPLLLLKADWSFVKTIAGSSCVANTAASSLKVAVVLSDVRRLLVCEIEDRS